jgi:polyhydroxyalkanoate synthesis regulator phasin
LEHTLKDRNARAREAIGALTGEVADLRKENKKLLDQLVAAGLRNDELAQALRADLAVRA